MEIWTRVHGQELEPVAAEAAGIEPRVDDKATELGASCLPPQGELSLPLRHIVADVDQLYYQ